MVKRLAVVVRTHLADEKTRDILKSLSRGRGYELYVAANETAGPLDLTPYRKLPHSIEDMYALGIGIEDASQFQHFSDQIFSLVQSSIPHSDFYILVENDVHLTLSGHDFMEKLVAKLSSPEYADVDFFGTHFGRPAPDWRWYEASRKMFAEVLACFFPLIGLSKRAIDCLRETRKREAREAAAGQERIFCEAFVPSALSAAGGFRMIDLFDLMPGSYSDASFNMFHPQPLSSAKGGTPEIAILHPVYADRDFLERRLKLAEANGTLDRFMEELDTSYSSTSIALRVEVLKRAQAARPAMPAKG